MIGKASDYGMSEAEYAAWVAEGARVEAKRAALDADAADQIFAPLLEKVQALDEAERVVMLARFERDQELERLMPRVGEKPGEGQATPYRIASVMRHWEWQRKIRYGSRLGEPWLGRLRKVGAFMGQDVSEGRIDENEGGL